MISALRSADQTGTIASGLSSRALTRLKLSNFALMLSKSIGSFKAGRMSSVGLMYTSLPHLGLYSTARRLLTGY